MDWLPIGGHAYTVLSVSGNNVTLYNPWGSFVTVSWSLVTTDGASIEWV